MAHHHEATESDPTNHDPGALHAHVMPVWLLIGIWVALMGFTGLTYAASVFEFGAWEIVITLFIATIKAVLVILFFMHMLYEKPLNMIFFLSCFGFVALFVGFTLIDSTQYQPDIRAKVEVDAARNNP